MNKNFKKHLYTVTPLSKAIAAALFIALPILAFYMGIIYQEEVRRSEPQAEFQRAVKPMPTSVLKAHK